MANGKAELTTEQLRITKIWADWIAGGPAQLNGAFDWLPAAIAEAERVDPLNGWIPVSERLPSLFTEVQVCRADTKRAWVDYRDIFGCWVKRQDGTHWKEIGQLPKMSKEESHV